MNSTNEAYIAEAMRTSTQTQIDNFRDAMESGGDQIIRAIHGAVGIATESGEILDALKRSLFYGKPLDKTNLEEEIGDVFWYLAELCDAIDITFEGAQAKNIAKLKARYPNAFTNESALNRDLPRERSVLEGGQVFKG